MNTVLNKIEFCLYVELTDFMTFCIEEVLIINRQAL